MAKIELRRTSRTKAESTYISGSAANVTSQFGEDGIIAKLLELIGERNRWCVEFGAWDGKQHSNTWHLINELGWSAMLIEGDATRAAALAEAYQGRPAAEVFVRHALVGWHEDDSLDALLAGDPIPVNFDVLSIDVDGNDWHIWNAVRLYRPRIVLIEFNPTAGNDLYFVQEPDPAAHQGASLLAMIELAKDKGYELAATTAINAFFVLAEDFPLLGIADNSIHSMYESTQDLQLCHGYDGTVFAAGNMMLNWHGITLEQEDLQVLPANMRRFPGATG